MYFFLFNRTTLQVFVTYLIGALYVHPLWFYKHQHDNRVRSKLFVACQRWWLQWRFWFVPSVPGYLREEEEHKPDPWRNPIERNHMGLHLENEVARRVATIINGLDRTRLSCWCLQNHKGCTYRAPIRYVTKTCSVVPLNKKNTYTPISSVLCMTSC